MKHYILTIALLFASCGLMAQENKQENAPKTFVKVVHPPLMEQNKYLSLSAGGGLSTMLYDLPIGESEMGLGGRLNIDYNIFFSKVWGVSFGLGGSKINSTMSILEGEKYSTPISIPVTYSDWTQKELKGECITEFSGWKEEISTFALEMPVGFLLRAPMGQKCTFLTGFGMKLMFPIKTSYEVVEGSIEKSAYIEDLNATINSDLEDYGFTKSDVHPSGSAKTKMFSLGFYLDLNLVHKLKHTDLFYGFYGDLGVTNIAKKDMPLSNTEEYNSLIASDAIGKAKPFAVGFRIGLKIPCPKLTDEDRDGVTDKFDLCPNTPAGLPVDTCGCPLDTDGDGVYDYLDRCGDTPKGILVDTCGCPLDSDGDGIPDHMDKCPYTPKNTPVDNYGCPFDTDKDGVPDYMDKCPDTPEDVKVDENGCPLDSDGDGVPDYLDKCPTIPGIADNQGCPDVSKRARQIFQQAEHGIAFEPGTPILLKSSCVYIDKIISIMKEYPSYRLVVNGHTNPGGSAAVNLKLSKRRAMAVVDYMVEHGIYPSRLKSFGHGGLEPISDSKSETGRRRNERIEFKVEFDQ